MLSGIALSLALLVPTISSSPSAGATPLRLAIPPFIAQPIGMEYEVLPTSGQLATLQSSFVHAFNSMPHFRAVRISQTCNPVVLGSCDHSRAAAAKAGAAVVVQAYVTRHMAVFWDVDFLVMDARTGRTFGPWDNEIKGDFDAVLFGMPGLAAGVAKNVLSMENRS